MPKTETLSLKDPSLLVDACLVAGEWVESGSGWIKVTNPATGALLALVPNLGAAETQQAIVSAHAAYLDWRVRTAAERATLLKKLAALISVNQEDLARIITAEQGKPLAEAHAEVAMSAAYVTWFAEEARRIYGEVLPSPWPHRRILVLKEPVGVVAAITPWNYPSSMVAHKLAPALAAGCPIVIKPAAQAPLSGLVWGLLCERAGIPSGVVSILTGSAQAIGGELMGNSLVRKVMSTGSTDASEILMSQAVDAGKTGSLELGDDAPLIVFDDADLDRAIEGATRLMAGPSDQTCISARRVLVQDGIYDTFAERMAAATRSLEVGNGPGDTVPSGPLIGHATVGKSGVQNRDTRVEAAGVIANGQRHLLGSSFLEPTIPVAVVPDMEFTRKRASPPVQVFRFKDEAEAIQMANDAEPAKACYFFTRDLGRAFRMSEALRYSMVGVNESTFTSDAAHLGEIKMSSVGRSGSRQGIEDYLYTKYVCFGDLIG